MAGEFTAALAQTVAENANVQFTNTAVCPGRDVSRRDGSGLITLRGIPGKCRTWYLVKFHANIAVPTGGAAGEISLAIVVEGEPLDATVMSATPAAAEEFWNVSAEVLVPVSVGCCQTVSVRNVSDQAITVRNANLIVA